METLEEEILRGGSESFGEGMGDKSKSQVVPEGQGRSCTNIVRDKAEKGGKAEV